MNWAITGANKFSGQQVDISRISLVQITESVRKYKHDRPFIYLILRNIEDVLRQLYGFHFLSLV
jgi:hypothetical protein